MACSSGTTSPALRLLLRWNARGRGQHWQNGFGLMAMSSSRTTTGQPSCFCLAAPLPPWQIQTRRGAHVRAGGKPARSPTVRRVEKQSAGPPNPNRSDGRPAANRIFPADLSSLMIPLEAAIHVLESEFTGQDCIDILALCRQVYEGEAFGEAALKKDYGLTPYKMHSVALLLLFGATTTTGGARLLPLATTLLHMAGSAPSRPGGYLPSTLTTLSMFGGERSSGPDERQQRQQRRMRDMQFYQDAEKRFLAYLSTKQNVALSPTSDGNSSVEDVIMLANAFTQAGLLAETGGNSSRALRWFRAAREVGAEIPVGAADSSRDGHIDDTDTRPRESRWDWERRCLEAIGRLQAAELRQQQQQQEGSAAAVVTTMEHQQQRQQLYQQAKAALRTAALALNSGVACLLLATEYATREVPLDDGGQGVPPQVKEEDPYEVETLLYRAAAAAIPGASEALAARAEAKLTLDHGGDGGRDSNKASKELQLLAEEWRAIATASGGQQRKEAP